ncbi:MAG: beta-1,6-N-acetylglucosaminyltransferase [Bacteroidaceae bacterium]|nr:beta-1,6-N-acetylglucosaminyltransferase [Bacteroidaceae bacterium]
MRIAFVISVFDNPKQANCFIKQAISYSGSTVFVHVDAKNQGIAEQLIKDSNVIILPKHIDVTWAEYSQIEMYNYLFQSVREYGKFDYISLNSGNDLFIRPVKEFVDYLSETHLYGYYNCEPLPKSYWQFRGGYGRIAVRWPKCMLRRLPDHHPMRYLRTLYGQLYHYHLIPGRKLPANIRFIGGNDWFTISQDCLDDMMEYIDNHEEWNRLFYHSYIGTEIYYVTLFEMLKGDRPVCDKNNLRFVDWKERGQKKNAGSPNILTMECIEDIESSQRFFGRKFDCLKDQEVVDYFMDRTVQL